MTIACWNFTTDFLNACREGRKGTAVIILRKTDHRLEDGTLVRPWLRPAKEIVEAAMAAISMGLPAHNFFIEEGTFEIRNLQAEERRQKARELQWERFLAFCKEDGIDNGRRWDDDRKCWEIYQPDAMGYPCHVLDLDVNGNAI